MTAAPAGHSNTSPLLFSLENIDLYRAKGEFFAASLLGQALILSLIILFTMWCTTPLPPLIGQIPRDIRASLPIVFSGRGGGSGGALDPLPANHGAPPRASLDTQLTPPSVIVLKTMPRLPVEPTVVVAPDVRLPQGDQYGDPWSKFSAWLSNGPGGPTGIGPGCCGGVGPGNGLGVGPGPGGNHLAGVRGVTVPRAIYSPEPSFSDEARKAKQQGIVVLILLVGTDGRAHDIHVQSSLGMGLDEKAIEAVGQWRFQPATLNGQAVATQIAVEVNFHLF